MSESKPELDDVTRRAVQILEAADEMQLKPQHENNWRDPLAIAAILSAVAVVGLCIAVLILTHSFEQSSTERTSQLNGLSDQVRTLTHTTRNLSKLNTHLDTKVERLQKQNDGLAKLVISLGGNPSALIGTGITLPKRTPSPTSTSSHHKTSKGGSNGGKHGGGSQPTPTPKPTPTVHPSPHPSGLLCSLAPRLCRPSG